MTPVLASLGRCGGKTRLIKVPHHRDAIVQGLRGAPRSGLPLEFPSGALGRDSATTAVCGLLRANLACTINRFRPCRPCLP